MPTKNNDDEKNTRRNFIKSGVALTAGFSLTHVASIASAHQKNDNESSELNGRAEKLMALFNLKYPIFQAAPGGEILAIALANAGAMGAISLTMNSPEDAFKKIVKVKAATNGNFYGNYILHFEPESLDKALEAGLPIVQFSWGIPSKTIVSKIRAANAKLGIQVSSRENAKAALELNPDFLICQGVEAGGHVQASEPLLNSLSEVTAEAKEVPVLASGGISSGHDIRRILNSGASGVVMGSRFVATAESDLHDDYKQSLVNAGENSTVFTTCFNREWSALHRVLKNKTFQMWQAAGCPLAGNRPGEDDVVAQGDGDYVLKRYSIMPPYQWLHGKLTELAMYAGEGVPNIKDIPSANDLLLRLWKEFSNK
jgi:nitronate monooxygenase